MLTNGNAKSRFYCAGAEYRHRTKLFSCLFYKMLRFSLNKQLFESEKRNRRVVFWQRPCLTTEKIGFIIVTMPEHPKSQSKKSDKNGKQPKGHTTNDHSRFGPLGKSIVQSLPIGVVAFDQDLKIIEANRQAAELIELGDYIDKSLAKGTDDKVWLGWRQQL
ncbi:MAG: PAS domain-containing protein, partial [Planctomycetota bacterium]